MKTLCLHKQTAIPRLADPERDFSKKVTDKHLRPQIPDFTLPGETNEGWTEFY